MSEGEVAAALAVTERNPQWRAFLQLLEDFLEGTRTNVGTDIRRPTVIAWNAGGADYLAQFRDFVKRRRSEAQGLFRRHPAALKRVAVTTGMRDGSGRRPEDEE